MYIVHAKTVYYMLVELRILHIQLLLLNILLQSPEDFQLISIFMLVPGHDPKLQSSFPVLPAELVFLVERLQTVTLMTYDPNLTGRPVSIVVIVILIILQTLVVIHRLDHRRR